MGGRKRKRRHGEKRRGQEDSRRSSRREVREKSEGEKWGREERGRVVVLVEFRIILRVHSSCGERECLTKRRKIRVRKKLRRVKIYVHNDEFCRSGQKGFSEHVVPEHNFSQHSTETFAQRQDVATTTPCECYSHETAKTGAWHDSIF